MRKVIVTVTDENGTLLDTQTIEVPDRIRALAVDLVEPGTSHISDATLIIGAPTNPRRS